MADTQLVRVPVEYPFCLDTTLKSGQLFHWEQDDAPHINLYPVGVSIVPAGMATLQEISECIRTVPGHESDIMIGWVDNNGGLR